MPNENGYMEPKQFTVVDPRTIDGTPYEIAEKGVAQLAAVVKIAEDLKRPTYLMVRNAHMDRQFALGEKIDGAGYDDTAEGKKWAKVTDLLVNLQQVLRILHRAAGFDPKAPLGKDG